VRAVQSNSGDQNLPQTGSAGVAEWRRGWPLVAIIALILTCTPITLPVYTLGVFVKPLQVEFGWGRGQIETAILFSTGISALCAPLMGELVQRYGARRSILPGIAGVALAFAFASQISNSLWQFFGAYALMAILGAGASAIACTQLVNGAFNASRGLALGMALSGTGLCAVLMPKIATWALELWGWRGAYVALAATAMLVVLPLAYLFVPRDAGHREAKRAESAAVASQSKAKGIPVSEAVQSRQFWILGLSIALAYLAIGGIIPNIIPALTDKGMTAQVAGSVMSGYGLAIVLGRISVGALLDRFWAPAVAVAVMVPAALACFVFTLPAGLATYAIAVLVIGVATGMEFDVLAYMVTRYFGMRDYARIYGRLYVFLAGAAGVSPMLFGFLHDNTGGYDFAFQASAAALALGGLLLLTLGRYQDEQSASPDQNSSGQSRKALA
jgi:MFS family permease